MCGDADPDRAGWVLIGGADLSETDPGNAFVGSDLDFQMRHRGRPAPHRPGRRSAIADRRIWLQLPRYAAVVVPTDFAVGQTPTQPLWCLVMSWISCRSPSLRLGR